MVLKIIKIATGKVKLKKSVKGHYDESSSGNVRTNYLGAWYDACWDGCGTDRTCCANTYFYHQYGCNDKTCYYSYCTWVEGQRCSSFDPCTEPGGTNP